MRFTKYAPSLRNNPKYRALSRPAPNARDLFDRMITGDCTSLIPGLFVAGPGALMEELGWREESLELQNKVWSELIASGLVRYDDSTRLIWLPQLVQDVFLPEQPNILQTWGRIWSELPDCDLKHEAWTAFRAAFEARTAKRVERGADSGTVFGRLFVECCPEPECPRAEALRKARSEAQAEAQNEAQGEPQNAEHGGSGRASARGSLLKEKEEEREGDQEPGKDPDPPRSKDPPARGKGDAPDPDRVKRVLDEFKRRAGPALGVQPGRENLCGALGMPQLVSLGFMESWRAAQQQGWTDEELLTLADWIAAGGWSWSKPAYAQLEKKLIDGLNASKAWANDGRPSLAQATSRRRGPSQPTRSLQNTSDLRGLMPRTGRGER